MFFTRYHIVPKDDNCSFICIHKNQGFIKVPKGEYNSNDNIQPLDFSSYSQCDNYLKTNFLNPENYTVQEYSIDDEHYEKQYGFKPV